MYQKYIELLQSRLNEKRFIHSMNVAKKAREMAEKFRADSEKAYFAGLLHDICKNDSKENMLQIFEEFGIMLDDVQKASFKLWHSIAGAAYIEHKLGITDRELIDSVRYHTTARANATLMDKIIYLADYISDERDFDGVDDLRRDLEVGGLDLCYKSALKMSIIELCEIDKPVHPDTLNAYNSTVLK